MSSELHFKLAMAIIVVTLLTVLGLAGYQIAQDLGCTKFLLSTLGFLAGIGVAIFVITGLLGET